MAEKVAIAIGYYTNEHGVRAFHTLGKDENWFWGGMRKRLKDGRLKDIKTCCVSYLPEPTTVKNVKSWTPEVLATNAPDLGWGVPPTVRTRLTKQTPITTLLDEIRQRKPINESTKENND